MTNADTPQVASKIEALEAQLSASDALLRVWVGMASREAISFDITVVVGGAVITGTLASPRQYAKEIADAFRESGGSQDTWDELEDALGEMIGDQEFVDRDELPDDPQSLTPEQRLDLLKEEPRYIHLKDAQVLHSSELIPSNSSVCWRGKLSSVDGWIMGRLSTP